MVAHFREADGTYIRIDTTNRNGKHAVEACPRESDESDQIGHAEEHSKETCLDSTTNKLVEHSVCSGKTNS